MRCYNGCPDKELQALIDAKTNAWTAMKRRDPEVHCTYHHYFSERYEHGWQVHRWGVQLGGFYPSMTSAINAWLATEAKGSCDHAFVRPLEN